MVDEHYFKDSLRLKSFLGVLEIWKLFEWFLQGKEMLWIYAMKGNLCCFSALDYTRTFYTFWEIWLTLKFIVLAFCFVVFVFHKRILHWLSWQFICLWYRSCVDLHVLSCFGRYPVLFGSFLYILQILSLLARHNLVLFSTLWFNLFSRSCIY